MRRILVGFTALLWSVVAFAGQKFYFNDTQGEHILELYSEDSRFLLDHYLIPKNKLQDRIAQHFFENRTLAMDYIRKNYPESFNKRVSQSFFVKTENKNKVIWQTKNEWNEEWEERYHQWVEKNLAPDLFVRYNLATDCADVAFALRWIFARMNFLPAANTLAGSGVLFTHESFKDSWVNLETNENWQEDKLFLAALKYLLRNAYTGTLNIDTYPIKIEAGIFRVGTIYLTGHHTMIISEINHNQDKNNVKFPIKHLSSTTPAAVRNLMLGNLTDPRAVDASQGGMLRMRWPRKLEGAWTLVAKAQMPHHSMEQYDQSFPGKYKSFAISIINRIGIDFEPKELVKGASQDILNTLSERIKIVEDGYAYCLNRSCEEGSSDYEGWSTPSRDGRIAQKFKDLTELIRTLKAVDSTIQSFWEEYKKNLHFEVDGHNRTFHQMQIRFTMDQISHHPKDSISRRWGSKPDDIIQTLSQRAEKLIKERTILVDRAQQTCFPNACNQNDLSTLAIDSKLKLIYNSYNHLEKANNYQLAQINRDLFQRLPFYLSDPNLKLRERWGEHMQEDMYYLLPPFATLLQFGADYFVIDQNRVFDAKEQKFINSPQDIKSIQVLDDKIALALHQDKLYWLAPPYTNWQSLNLDSSYQTLMTMMNGYIVLAKSDAIATEQPTPEVLQSGVCVFKFDEEGLKEIITEKDAIINGHHTEKFALSLLLTKTNKGRLYLFHTDQPQAVDFNSILSLTDIRITQNYLYYNNQASYPNGYIARRPLQNLSDEQKLFQMREGLYQMPNTLQAPSENIFFYSYFDRTANRPSTFLQEVDTQGYKIRELDMGVSFYEGKSQQYFYKTRQTNKLLMAKNNQVTELPFSLVDNSVIRGFGDWIELISSNPSNAQFSKIVHSQTLETISFPKWHPIFCPKYTATTSTCTSSDDSIIKALELPNLSDANDKMKEHYLKREGLGLLFTGIQDSGHNMSMGMVLPDKLHIHTGHVLHLINDSYIYVK